MTLKLAQTSVAKSRQSSYGTFSEIFKVCENVEQALCVGRV